jgi:phage portal protein BeeE
MSRITPVIREVQADSGMTMHKDSYLSKGATPNMIVKLDTTPEDFERFVGKFKAMHEGAANAYKTLFLAAGADATVVGSNFQQMSFKEVQGAGETRIAAASGIHPVIVGLSEGMQGSSLNAGNFNSARRLTADKTLRPLWRNWCGSVSSVINVPSASELWVDLSDVAFLREDEKDAAEIQSTQSQSIKALVEAGYTPETVVDAVISGDFSRLKHSGLYSVQLQPPGTQLTPTAPTNGSGKPTTLVTP